MTLNRKVIDAKKSTSRMEQMMERMTQKMGIETSDINPRVTPTSHITNRRGVSIKIRKTKLSIEGEPRMDDDASVSVVDIESFNDQELFDNDISETNQFSLNSDSIDDICTSDSEF